jgi:O-6-methylguanine DNA methyltransferase
MIEINWQIESSKFGFVLIVTYNKKLVVTEFNESDYPLIVGLANKFSNREEVRLFQFGIDNNIISDIMAVIEKGENKNISYRLLGTPFQTKVWEEISKIPYGETRTYGQIAEAIGRPKAYRAVGSACGKNHLGVIVPCHRVIPANGSIGQYAWGKKMKTSLLQREGINLKW